MNKHLVTRLLAGVLLTPILASVALTAPSGATAPKVATVTTSYLGHYKYEIAFSISAMYPYLFPGRVWIAAPTSSPLVCNVKVARGGATKCEVNLASVASATAELIVQYHGAHGSGFSYTLHVKTHLPTSVISPPVLLDGLTTEACTSVGNCTGVGGAFDFVAITEDEIAGVWSQPQILSFTNTADANGASLLTNVTCSSIGNCTAVGTDASGLMAASEISGVWGNGQDISMGNVSNRSGVLEWSKLVCSSAGNCTSLGDSNGQNPFVVSEVSGVWGTAKLLAVAEARSMYASPSLSCTVAGTCRVVGLFTSRKGVLEQFTFAETSGAPGTYSTKVLSAAQAWAAADKNQN